MAGNRWMGVDPNTLFFVLSPRSYTLLSTLSSEPYILFPAVSSKIYTLLLRISSKPALW